MCSVLQISRSTYYYESKKKAAETKLTAEIKRIFCCIPLYRKSRFYQVSLNLGKVRKISFAILFISGMVKIVLGYGEYSDLCNFECYTMFINCVGYRYGIEHVRFKLNSVLSE